MLHLGPMDLSKLIVDSLDANEGYAATYGIRFNARGGDQPIMVNGDKIRLMQVMSNLMSNAAKFSNKGEVVTVSLDRTDSHVRVCVKDTGAGIPKAAQETIFNRFTQADSSDQRKKGGTGLGLNIAKNLVAGHGGKIAFDSVVGQGTTFYFDLEILADAAHNPTERMKKSLSSKSNNQTEDLRPCERGSAECIATLRNPDKPDLPDNTRTAPMN